MPQLPEGWSPNMPSKHGGPGQVLFRGKFYKRCPAGFVKDLAQRTCVPADSKEVEDESKKKEKDFMDQFELVVELETGDIFYNPETGQTVKKLDPGQKMSDFEQELIKKYGGDIEAVNDRAVLFDDKFELNLSSAPTSVMNEKQKNSLFDKVQKMHREGYINNNINPDNILINKNNSALIDFSKSEKLGNENKLNLTKDIEDLSNLIENTGVRTFYDRLVKDTAKKLRLAGDDGKKITQVLKEYMTEIE